MSFDSIETSVDLGRPVTLFEFTYGDGRGDVLRYVGSTDVLITGGAAPLVAMSRAWTPAPIKHGKITASGSLDKAAIDVMTVKDSDLADLYRVAPPSRQVTLEIFRGNVGSTEYKRIWSGRVINGTFEDAELKLSCEPVSTSTLRVGLRRNYQYGCPHVLYGTACGLSRLANMASGTVQSITNAQTIVFKRSVRSLVIPANEVIGGVFTLTLPSGREVKRSIIAATPVAGDDTLITVKLMSVVPDLAVNLPVTLTRGCAHNFEACKKFGNTVNYGGCPNIPTKNPFTANSF